MFTQRGHTLGFEWDYGLEGALQGKWALIEKIAQTLDYPVSERWRWE